MTVLPRLLSISLTLLLVLGPASAQPPLENLQLRLIGLRTEGHGSSSASRELIVQVNDGNGAPVADAAVTVHLPNEGLTGVFADGSRTASATSSAAGEACIRGIRWDATSGTSTLRITATKGITHAGIISEVKLEAAAIAPAVVAKATLEKEVVVPTQTPAAPVVSQPGNGKTAMVEPAKQEAMLRPHASPDSVALDSMEPHVSITTSKVKTGATQMPSHSGKKKWIILAVIAAGAAGGGVAFLSKSKSNTATTNGPTTPSIGAPTISIGLP